MPTGLLPSIQSLPDKLSIHVSPWHSGSTGVCNSGFPLRCEFASQMMSRMQQREPRRLAQQVRGNLYHGMDGDINDNFPFAPPEHTGKEYGAKVALNNDEEVEFMNELMGDFNFDSEDSNKGIEVYCEVVIGLIAIYASKFTIPKGIKLAKE
ncbi:hypothetical protein IW261DRAFT_1597273 [Armillaria novae-zelandiae]|uniref:Uncharacterized protein n=1 Tax=Armillaria novae-zelandiae TaxID=153914 RepID=A0AA39NTU3_9AGAR|nr:hypothetical protein IW261DRAFT_1597273 [Armillaria novae-zelandiae]